MPEKCIVCGKPLGEPYNPQFVDTDGTQVEAHTRCWDSVLLWTIEKYKECHIQHPGAIVGSGIMTTTSGYAHVIATKQKKRGRK